MNATALHIAHHKNMFHKIALLLNMLCLLCPFDRLSKPHISVLRNGHWGRCQVDREMARGKGLQLHSSCIILFVAIGLSMRFEHEHAIVVWYDKTAFFFLRSFAPMSGGVVDPVPPKTKKETGPRAVPKRSTREIALSVIPFPKRKVGKLSFETSY